MDKHQRFSRYQSLGISLGMCFGVSIGLVFGSMLFDKSTTGMCFGVPLGMMLGIAIGKAKDDRINEQLRTKGYTISGISDKGDGYEVTLKDRNGECVTVTLKQKAFAEGKFSVGDPVYKYDDGRLEAVKDFIE